MGKILDSLISVFNRSPSGELKYITDAVDSSLSTLQEDISLLNLEYVISTSTGDWLNEWGKWFEVTRLTNESDVSYRGRIKSAATKPKVSIPALISTVQSYLNDPAAKISIYEPHVDVAVFSKSVYSGTHKFQTGDYYRSGVIDVVSPIMTSELKQILNKSKASGVKLSYTILNEMIQDGSVLDSSFPLLDSMAIEYEIREIKLVEMSTAILSAHYSGIFGSYPRAGKKNPPIENMSQFDLLPDWEYRQILCDSYILLMSILDYIIDEIDIIQDIPISPIEISII